MQVCELPAHTLLNKLHMQVTPPVLESCAKKGIHNVVIVSGGGKELGGERADFESQIKSLSEQHKIRIVNRSIGSL